MLNNICSDACYSIADFIANHTNATGDIATAKKTIDAMFKLQEVEITADDNVFNKREIYDRSNYCIVNKFLYCCDSYSDTKNVDLENFKCNMRNLFEINDRLKKAFLDFQIAFDLGKLDFDVTSAGRQFLNDLCEEYQDAD